MTELDVRHYKEISVKAYAKLINKSDKTVYKMIKEGLVAASKKDKSYMIRVDNFMLDRCEDMQKSIYTMKALMESFSLRLEKIEKKERKTVSKKVTVKKKLKPLKKSIKKPLAKPKKIMKKVLPKATGKKSKKK